MRAEWATCQLELLAALLLSSFRSLCETLSRGRSMSCDDLQPRPGTARQALKGSGCVSRDPFSLLRLLPPRSSFHSPFVYSYHQRWQSRFPPPSRHPQPLQTRRPSARPELRRRVWRRRKEDCFTSTAEATGRRKVSVCRSHWYMTRVTGGGCAYQRLRVFETDRARADSSPPSPLPCAA